jgi:hypothetical protein
MKTGDAISPTRVCASATAKRGLRSKIVSITEFWTWSSCEEPDVREEQKECSSATWR